MTFVLLFNVEITPVAKGRARYARRGNFVSTYTPKKTKDYETVIREQAILFMKEEKPLETPVSVSIEFSMPMPKSTPKKLLEAHLNGSIRHTKKPDLDNLAKAVLDAMNGVVFLDDSQIVKLTLSKRYSKLGNIQIFVSENLD